MAQAIVRKSDLTAIRDANLRVVRNESGEYSANDVARASRVLTQLKQVELRIDGVVGKTPPQKHIEPLAQPVHDEPVIYKLDFLTRNTG